MNEKACVLPINIDIINNNPVHYINTDGYLRFNSNGTIQLIFWCLVNNQEATFENIKGLNIHNINHFVSSYEN